MQSILNVLDVSKGECSTKYVILYPLIHSSTLSLHIFSLCAAITVSNSAHTFSMLCKPFLGILSLHQQLTCLNRDKDNRSQLAKLIFFFFFSTQKSLTRQLCTDLLRCDCWNLALPCLPPLLFRGPLLLLCTIRG